MLDILIVDDIETNRIILKRLLAKLGYHAKEATNGQEAVDAFRAEPPDLIIMDVMMPVMDGYEATRIIKAESEKWIPVIFLTALDQVEQYLKGLEIGGDDFISKPFNFAILTAKLQVFARAIEMQKQILEKNAALALMQARSDHEMQMGKYVLDRLLERSSRAGEMVSSWVQPLSIFSGDIVLSTTSPEGVLYTLHADSQGHGLSAALAIIPVIELFYTMCEKGFGVGTIVKEMNWKIRELMPVGYFMAGTLVSVDLSQGLVSVWNGGNPAALLADNSGRIHNVFDSRHPPLGILSDKEFDSTLEFWSRDRREDTVYRIYLVSDGIVDAEGLSGYFGMDRIVEIVSSTDPDERVQKIREAIAEHCSDRERRDDMSVVEVTCSGSEMLSVPVSGTSMAQQASSLWGFRISISASQIKRLDLTPVIMGIINSLGVDQRHNGHIFLILSELINNAIDHGLLELDSSEKQNPHGLERYFEMRAQRLASIEDAKIEIDVKSRPELNRDRLLIRIRDSGKGFDHSRYAALGENETPHGRGIALIRSLCSMVEYIPPGNEVTVAYDMN